MHERYIETQIARKTVDVSSGQAKASTPSMEPLRLTIGEATALAKERGPWLMLAKEFDLRQMSYNIYDYICKYIHTYIYIYTYTDPSSGLFLVWDDSGSCCDFFQLDRYFPKRKSERFPTWESSKISFTGFRELAVLRVLAVPQGY